MSKLFQNLFNVCCLVQYYIVVLFAVAASHVIAYISHPTQLLCGVVDNKTTDWMYQASEHSRHKIISLNGTLSVGHDGKYAVNGSNLIINEVKVSDGGFYTCGQGRQLYHKLRLSVSGL